MMMLMRLTRGVKFLLIACFVTFLVQQILDRFFATNLLSWLALVPSALVFQHRVWQVVTYTFLHADVMHLFFNLLMLAFIGSELEALWGTVRFLRYFFFCSIASGMFYLLLVFLWKGAGLHLPMVGASAGIYGFLVAYGVLFGERVLLFMLLFPMKAKHFIWVLAAIEFLTTLFSGQGGQGSGLSSVAHLGGMGAGLGYLWGWATLKKLQKRAQQHSPQGSALRKKRDHLKLVINRERNNRNSDPPHSKTWH